MMHTTARRLALVVTLVAHAGAGRAAAQQPATRDTVRDTSTRRTTLAPVVVAPAHVTIVDIAPGVGGALTHAEIRARPQLGEDLFRMVNALPGVATSDYSAALHVRGARADELLVTLDGLELLEPFHLKDLDGALSIVDVETAGTVALTAAAFPADRGERLGAHLAIRTAEPAGAVRTAVGLSVTGVRARTEGTFAGGSATWLASARRGYLDLALRLAGAPDSINPHYDDAFAKLTVDVNAANRVRMEGLHAADAMALLDRDLTLRSSYGSDYLWGSWETHPTASLTGTTTVSWSSLAWRRDGATYSSSRPADPVHDHRDFTSVGVRHEWAWDGGAAMGARWGASVRDDDALYDYDGRQYTPVVRAGARATDVTVMRTLLTARATSSAAWIVPRVAPRPWLMIEPGLRAEVAGAAREWIVSPRLNVAATVGGTTVRAAVGRFAQAQPLYALDVADGATDFAPADLAEHRVIGVEREVRGVQVRIEAYERRTLRQRTRFVNLAARNEFFPEDEPDRTAIPSSRGVARGVDAVLRGTGGTIGWTVAYSNARTTDVVGDVQVARLYDQRQAGRVDLTWRPGGGAWRVSAAWLVHEGWPDAPVSFRVDTLRNSRGGFTGTATSTLYGPVESLGTTRLPWYHRTDLRASRDVDLPRGRLAVYLDLFNVFDVTNVRSWTYHTSVNANRLAVTRTSNPWLGRLPSAGVTWEF